LTRSLEQLYTLGALGHDGELTQFGRNMAELPLEPQLSKTLLSSVEFNITEEMVTIAAMLTCGAIFYKPKDRQFQANTTHRFFFKENVGDHIALLTAFNEWKKNNYSLQFCFENYIQVRVMKRARDMKDQLIGMMLKMEIELLTNATDYISIQRCITAGYFMHAARVRKDKTYRTIPNQTTAYIHPSSGLAHVSPKYVIYHELIYTTREYMRNVIEIKPIWLIESAPQLYRQNNFDYLREDLAKVRGNSITSN
jgi:pre-mRNA-splicing factor ATP-dependent RNA helicase DHX16